MSDGGQLTPEVENKPLKMALGAHGEIGDIQLLIRRNAYRYLVSSGVRVVCL
jgi:hypothetical protein